jgi:hypothetical protein
MTAAVIERNRLAVPLLVATGAAALALALGGLSSGGDDPVAAPAQSAPVADLYESRTGSYPGLR